MSDITEFLSVYHLKKVYHELEKELMGHPAILQRLTRAHSMLTDSTDYSFKGVSKSPLTFAITSPNDTYTVIPAQKLCTCPDNELLCKHRLAVKLVLDCLARQKARGVGFQGAQSVGSA